MADKSFDVVLIGGGSKGLVAAMYLTKYGGMSVGIFEDRAELGGGWSSDESPAPGFIANHCSNNHAPDIYHVPVYEDFPEWREYGAKYGYWPVSMGVSFKEDYSCLGVYSAKEDPNQEKTAEWMAKFSKKDADTWLRLWDKGNKYIIPALLEWLFSPAQPFGVPDAADKLIMNPDAGIDPAWLYMSPAQLYRDLFESKEAQVLFVRVVQAGGITPDEYGNGFGALMLMLLYTVGLGAAIGGNHQVAHASQKVILENGGKIFPRSKVDKIIIENGKAKGVRLADGTEIEAKKLVLSGVDPYQLCVELIDKEHLSDKIRRRIKNLERDWITITWYTWALYETPKYKSEGFNPDIRLSSSIHFGSKDLDAFFKEVYSRRLRRMPELEDLNPLAVEMTIPDPSVAPPNRSCVLTEQWAIPAWKMSEIEWKKFEKEHADDILKIWSRHASNMTWDNVIGYVPVTPFFTSRHARNWGPAGNWAVIDHPPSQLGRFRPIPELASGRMPIKNLYATGAGWHPFAGAHSTQGYNIYKIIAEDFGLRKPWVEKGRPW
jgi:phytoene dehydrogenase-like protein